MNIIKSGNSIKKIIASTKVDYEDCKNDSCYSCSDMGCVCEDENND